jgi:hypothetical protein
MSNTTPNPLAAPMLKAQEIVIAALRGDLSDRLTIQRLAQVLCTPTANQLLVEAGAFDHLPGATARHAA